MNMKEHILAALREQFQRWEKMLAGMSKEQLTELPVLDDWSTKDVMTHLWAWQQISIARMEAGLRDSEPKFPTWITDSGEDWEDNADQSNAQIYEATHQKPWSEVYQNWRKGYLRFLELGEKISEIDLLDSSRYPWLGGRPLALILLASYDHHQEHFEKLTHWLQVHRN